MKHKTRTPSAPSPKVCDYCQVMRRIDPAITLFRTLEFNLALTMPTGPYGTIAWSLNYYSLPVFVLFDRCVQEYDREREGYRPDSESNESETEPVVEGRYDETSI